MLVLFILTGALTTSLTPGFSSGLRPQTSNQINPIQRTALTTIRNPQSKELTPGVPVEQELKGGEAHSYRLPLAAGQYLHAVVDQRGIAVALTLHGPDSQPIFPFYAPSSSQGPKEFSLVAEVTGDYRLEVRSVENEAEPGRYEVKIHEWREATAAEKLFAEGQRLAGQATADSRRQAIQKFQEARAVWRTEGDRRGEAEALSAMGGSYTHVGQMGKALESFSEARTLWHDVGEPRREALTLNSLAFLYQLLDERQKALDSFDQALSLWRALRDHAEEADALSAIGQEYQRLGEPARALDYYNEALPLHRPVRDRRYEAITLNDMGLAYQSLGELQKALEYFNQALALHRNRRDARREAASLASIGITYYSLGEPQAALQHLEQALRIRRAGAFRREEAHSLHTIGMAYYALGNPQKALEYLTQALQLQQTVKNRRGEAYALTGLGNVYALLGEKPKAIDSYTQALALFQTIRDQYGQAFALNGMGAVYDSVGETSKALDAYQQALTLRRAIGDRGGEASTLVGLARLERNRGNLSEARTQMETALTIIESQRRQLASPDLRTSFLASKGNDYDFYVDLLMRLHRQQPSAGHDAEAVQASERARARSLLELLAEARVDVQQGIDPALKHRERAADARLSWIQSELITAHSQAKPDPSRIAALEEELKKVDGEREQLELEIRQKHPRYADLQYPTPLGLEAIQQLLDDQTVLLEYALGQDASFVFAITKNEFHVARLAPAASLADRVKKLRDTMTQPGWAAFSNYRVRARGLYQGLIEPVGKFLAGKRALIIVPDGILCYFPFEVLLQPGGRRTASATPGQLPYLIRNYAISYVPSASVLASLRRQGDQPSPPSKSFVAYADPAYGEQELDQVSPAQVAIRSTFGEMQPWKLKRLRHSRSEVERIARLYPKQADFFLGDQAREENVKADGRLGQYRFLHFATHGLLNENKPQYSGLILNLPHGAGNPKSETRNPKQIPNPKSEIQNLKSVEDGLLQVYEIFNLKLNADLVVLSACETGLGKEVKGEGLIGLTRAFLYAGTPSVVVSLWKVADQSTAEVMVRLYRHLKGGRMNKAEALRQAQLEVIREGRFAHPYYWAPFVLVGQP
jgi:CHAT domain-containing protein/Tfp pilus assembly protein PilF